MSHVSRSRPFFSIIIPTWNRRCELERCIKSISGQDFNDYEIIIVDGASDDGTQEFLGQLNNPRIRVINDHANLGICPARNMGTKIANGKWFMFVDSDWELLPGALNKLHEMAVTAAPEIDVVGGYARTDYGEVWPTSPLPEAPFGYIEYLRWANNCLYGSSDWLACHRREIFRRLNWPMDLRSESQFHMRVARQSRFWVYNNVLSIEYTNSANRTIDDRTETAWARKKKRALDEATMHEEILKEFGPDLRLYAPEVYWGSLRSAAMFNFRANRRVKGLRYSVKGLALKPWVWRLWGLLLVGMAGERALKLAQNSILLKRLVGMFARSK